MHNIEDIRDIVKSYMSPKRFFHTIGVEKEAVALGKIFLPDKVNKLGLAGLLHDITKDFKTEKQLLLCEEYDIAIDKDNIIPKLLHSKTGSEFAKRSLGGDIVDDEIYSGIYYHTTGRANMTLFEAIIYLADYIEETRTFDDCVMLRKFFYDNIAKAQNYEEKIEVLRKTLIYSFDLTIKNLIEEEKQIDFDTIGARNYFVSCLKPF